MRIEDSVCVQEEHPLVLTTEAVKEVCLVFFFFFLVTFSHRYLSFFLIGSFMVAKLFRWANQVYFFC